MAFNTWARSLTNNAFGPSNIVVGRNPQTHDMACALGETTNRLA